MCVHPYVVSDGKGAGTCVGCGKAVVKAVVESRERFYLAVIPVVRTVWVLK